MTLTPVSSDDVIVTLGATAEMAQLRDRLTLWLDGVDGELRESLSWAFSGTPKHFRPLMLFACRRAVGKDMRNR